MKKNSKKEIDNDNIETVDVSGANEREGAPREESRVVAAADANDPDANIRLLAHAGAHGLCDCRDKQCRTHNFFVRLFWLYIWSVRVYAANWRYLCRRRISWHEAGLILGLFFRKRSNSLFFRLKGWLFLNGVLGFVHQFVHSANLTAADGTNALLFLRQVRDGFSQNPKGVSVFIAEMLHASMPAGFPTRNKKYFWRTHGHIMPPQVPEMIEAFLRLKPSENRFARLFVYQVGESLKAKLIHLSDLEEMEMVWQIFGSEDGVLLGNFMRQGRKIIFDSIGSYADLMMQDAISHGAESEACSWNAAFALVEQLKTYRPTQVEAHWLHEMMERLCAAINDAGSRTYVGDCVRGAVNFPEGTAADAAEAAAAEEPVAPPKKKSTRTKKGAEKAEKPLKEKAYGRFRISYFEKKVVIRDTVRSKPKRPVVYTFGVNTNAWEITELLMKYYSNGQKQFRESNGDWKLAFQRRSGGKTERNEYNRFRNEQIFIAPRWDMESHAYRVSDNQYSNRWRIIADDEVGLSMKELAEKYIEEHPKGPGYGRR